MVLLAGVWISACSSADEPQTDESKPSDSLLPPGTRADRTDTSDDDADGARSSSSGTTTTGSTGGGNGGGGTQTAEQCVAACEAKYPNGAQKGRAIDQCWTSRCPACQNMTTGSLSGPQRGSCGQKVSTPSATCSQCTVDKCCAAWDACFGDRECVALNACAVACYR